MQDGMPGCVSLTQIVVSEPAGATSTASYHILLPTGRGVPWVYPSAKHFETAVRVSSACILAACLRLVRSYRLSAAALPKPSPVGYHYTRASAMESAVAPNP